MSIYRIYFRDHAGICGRVEFDTNDDEAAMAIAEVLADACWDRCHVFELWQGARQLCERRKLSEKAKLSDIAEWQQAIVVKTEEAIAGSAFAIASSQRLLAKLSELGSPKKQQSSQQGEWTLIRYGASDAGGVSRPSPSPAPPRSPRSPVRSA